VLQELLQAVQMKKLMVIYTNGVEVLMGTSTWVGYNNPSENRAHPSNGFVFHRAKGMGDRAGQRALLTYVRDYRWTIDVQVVWEALISYRAIHRHGSN